LWDFDEVECRTSLSNCEKFVLNPARRILFFMLRNPLDFWHTRNALRFLVLKVDLFYHKYINELFFF